MSQHDYNIANGGGAAVRADINLALVAIQSQNSGLTAPTVTKPFMPWFDTTTGIFKVRNAADDGWINVVQLGNAQTFTAAQRGAVAPLTDGATITRTGTSSTYRLAAIREDRPGHLVLTVADAIR